MSSDTDTPHATSADNRSFTLSKHDTIDGIAGEWDELVPRDEPQLRSGYVRATERGDMLQAPEYYLVRQDGRLVAVALSYMVVLDTTMSASPRAKRWVDLVRKFYSGFLWRKMRICGPPVSNGECGFFFDPRLTPDDRRQVLRQVVQEVEAAAGRQQLIFVKEFTDQARDDYASRLEELGYFAVDPGPATSMPLRWSTFDDYLGALKKRYRRRVRSDLKAGEALEFELADSFADLAPTAASLYNLVVSKAKYNLEKATESYFRALSDFEQASLLVARHRDSSDVVGVNVLLFGDSCMHNLYIGFDYEQNQKFSIYFNLVEQSLRIAIERQYRMCYFGPASYEFKTRLGATTFPLTAYMKHPVPFVHRMLYSSRHKLWPEEVIPSHDVFQDGSAGGGE